MQAFGGEKINWKLILKEGNGEKKIKKKFWKETVFLGYIGTKQFAFKLFLQRSEA